MSIFKKFHGYGEQRVRSFYFSQMRKFSDQAFDSYSDKRVVSARAASTPRSILKKWLRKILDTKGRKLSRIEQQAVANQRLLTILLAESRETRRTINACHDKLRILMDDRAALDAHRETINEVMGQLAEFTDVITKRMIEHEQNLSAYTKHLQ